MKYSKACAVYALVIGIMMLLMWLFFIIAGMVPEFESKPAEISLHLAAEFITAGALIASALVMIKGHSSGKWLFPFSIGMLMYTLIVSPGYYIQSGDIPFVIMFGTLIVLSIIFLAIHLRHMKKSLTS